MFKFDRPYKQSDPQTIRDDFYYIITELDDGLYMAEKLVKYLSTDTLRQFMDDLAMGRV
jgi:hypothetical protein